MQRASYVMAVAASSRLAKQRNRASRAVGYSTILAEFLMRKFGNLRFRFFALCDVGTKSQVLRGESPRFGRKSTRLAGFLPAASAESPQDQCSWVRVLRLVATRGERSWLMERAMDSQVFGARRFPRTSALLASSAGLGWSALSAELRSHGVSEARTIVPQHVELILVIAGNQHSLVRRFGDGFCQEAPPRTGAIWLSPVGVGKEIAITAPIPQTLHMHLATELFDRLKDDFNLPVAPAHSIHHAAGIGDGVINQVGRSVLSELTAETSASRVYVETASLMLAARLIQKYCDSGTTTPVDPSAHGLDQIRLRRVLDYIEDNISKDVTLENLAAIAGYSAFHFSRKFTLAMGISPGRYISQRRLENAMAELAARKLPVAEIALNAQFSSQASFTRAFHRVTGTTPKEYQRRRRSGEMTERSRS